MADVNEKKNIKRKNIIDAAYNLFVKKSVSETAIDDIVNSAGVAKGTFYLYFKNKYDLLDQIIIYKSAELVEAAFKSLEEEHEKRSMDFLEQISYFTDCILDYMKSNPQITALISKNLTACFEEVTMGNNEVLRKSSSRMISAIMHLKSVSENEAKQIFYIIVELVGSVCCNAILYSKPYPLEEIKPVLYSMIKGFIEN